MDTFRYLATTDVTSQVFSSDGSCSGTVVTEVSVTKCYIDGTEQKTDANGNLAGEALAGFDDERRITDGNRAEDDAR